jgi:hypothetical protein
MLNRRDDAQELRHGSDPGRVIGGAWRCGQSREPGGNAAAAEAAVESTKPGDRAGAKGGHHDDGDPRAWLEAAAQLRQQLDIAHRMERVGPERIEDAEMLDAIAGAQLPADPFHQLARVVRHDRIGHHPERRSGEGFRARCADDHVYVQGRLPPVITNGRSIISAVTGIVHQSSETGPSPLPSAQGRILCVMPTFACTAACRHCGTFSSPRATSRLAEDALIGAIEQAAALGFTDVVFSGGEPTLAGDVLRRGMRAATQRGLNVRIVTNAHWAADADAAESRVAAFRADGLTAMTISTGDEHARFVPVDHVIHAVRACAAQSVPVFVSVETEAGRWLTQEAFEARPEVQSIRSGHPAAHIEVCAWLWSPLSPSRTARYREGATVHAGNVAERGRCPDMFSTTTVQADGTISPCCGLGIRFVPELRMGSIADITLADASRAARGDLLKR